MGRGNTPSLRVDSAGRKQYLYHASYRAAQERAKFDRLLEFAAALPRLRAPTESHLRLDPFEREWTCALAVGLVNKAWFRVGSDRHARSSRTYGVTTLRKRHVTVEGDEIAFCFRGKNRKLVRRTLRSAPLARGVEELLALPNGSRLFRFERDGELADLTGAELNAYLAEHMGDGVHRQGLPDVGRDALSSDGAGERTGAWKRERGQARRRASHTDRGGRAGEHRRCCPGVVREPEGRRRVLHGTVARRLSPKRRWAKPSERRRARARAPAALGIVSS